MATVVCRLHRNGVILATIVGSVLITADASAHKMSCNRSSDVARGIKDGVAGAALPQRLALDTGRLDAGLRLAESLAKRPWYGSSTKPLTKPRVFDGCPAPQVCVGAHARFPVHVGAGRLDHGGRLDGAPTLRHGKRQRMGFDDEYLEDRKDGDDDTDLPVRAWFRDTRLQIDAIVPASDCRFTFNDTPSSPPPSFQPLRC